MQQNIQTAIHNYRQPENPHAQATDTGAHNPNPASTMVDSSASSGDQLVLAPQNTETEQAPSTTTERVEYYLTRIHRLSSQLPGGNMIANMAQCALADMLIDSQTEAQLLHDLEIEKMPPAAPHNQPSGESPPKKARVENQLTPTATALQRISSKTQQRLASAGGHTYISYYDIQFDIDIVVTWLNGCMHTVATGGASATSSSAGPLHETGAILGNLGRALQGIQTNNHNGE